MSKSCQKVVKKLSKVVKKLSKSCQKVVKKLSQKIKIGNSRRITNIGKTIGHKDTRSDGRIDEEWKNRRRMEESTRNGLMMMNRGIRRLDATSSHLVKRVFSILLFFLLLLLFVHAPLQAHQDVQDEVLHGHTNGMAQ
jgi:hypothetical protein